MDQPGLGRERTRLAWQRTCLSLLVGAAIVARVSLDVSDLSDVVLCVIPLAACGLALASLRRAAVSPVHGLAFALLAGAVILLAGVEILAVAGS
jgi:uncharacterized membrane protein YidH (DUF202 family)